MKEMIKFRIRDKINSDHTTMIISPNHDYETRKGKKI